MKAPRNFPPNWVVRTAPKETLVSSDSWVDQSEGSSQPSTANLVPAAFLQGWLPPALKSSVLRFQVGLMLGSQNWCHGLGCYPGCCSAHGHPDP